MEPPNKDIAWMEQDSIAGYGDFEVPGGERQEYNSLLPHLKDVP